MDVVNLHQPSDCVLITAMTFAAPPPSAAAAPEFFVSTQWLEERLQQPDLRIIQVGGEKYYRNNHIPGAVLVPYSNIVERRDQVPGLRPSSEYLADLFGRLGIAIDTRVVAYDLTGGMDAARFLWTLTSMGNDLGRLLDGGLGSWFREQRPMTPVRPVVEAAVFTPRIDTSLEADRQRVIAATAADSPVRLIDTRSPREYLGMTTIGPRGHLAGAVHFDWMRVLVDRNDPRLKPRRELLAMLAEAGVTDLEQEIILYCETGHRAAQTLFMMRQLGFSKVRLYDGSMADWRVQDLPVVAGDAPR